MTGGKAPVILRSMPLNAPSIIHHRQPVRHPQGSINGKLAVHEGLDFSAPLGSAVLATAPGKVVFAGRNGSYGGWSKSTMASAFARDTRI